MYYFISPKKSILQHFYVSKMSVKKLEELRD